MFLKRLDAWPDDDSGPGRRQENLPGIAAVILEPPRIIEGSGIDAAGFRETLEGQLDLGAAPSAKVNMDGLAAAAGAVVIDAGRSLGESKIADRE